MIHEYSNANQTKWDHGDFKIQLRAANNPRPLGFSDGTADDLAELQAMAELEGSNECQILKKVLKSGREIWTLGDPNAEEFSSTEG